MALDTIRSFFTPNSTKPDTTGSSEKAIEQPAPLHPRDLHDEDQRAAYLQDAQDKASTMFDEIESKLLRPGILESTLNQEILELGAARHNVRTHWHKRVIRSGPNTLEPYAANPPDRMIESDDVCIIDLGPVFESWEADFGRTFVFGNDPHKLAIKEALVPTWRAVKARFEADEEITGEQLYAIAHEEANKAGWEFGGAIAGHLVGSFPHERIPADLITFYITKGSKTKMRTLDKHGHKRHWILEIHLADRERQYGAFMEQLLTVGEGV